MGRWPIAIRRLVATTLPVAGIIVAMAAGAGTIGATPAWESPPLAAAVRGALE